MKKFDGGEMCKLCGKMTCLKDTFWFVKSYKEDFNIIHAIVERQSDGLRHPHAVAYNKKTGNIHEVSNQFKDNHIVMPLKLWILLGRVSDIKQYTATEYGNLLIKFGKWDFFHEPHLNRAVKFEY